jgi:hypothetical protein
MDQVAVNAAQGGAAPAPQMGTAEYNAAMAAKGDQVVVQQFSTDGTQATTLPPSTPVETQVETPERPSWLPEKFKSPEDLVKSYSELEKKLTVPKPAESSEAQEAADAVSTGSFDVSAYSAEYEQNGSLSEASYAAMEKAGISRDMVDAYIEGQEARAASYANAGYEAAGGKEQFEAMTNWAKANLSKSEIAAFNSQVSTGNVDAMRFAIAGLQSKYVAANGVQPRGLMMGGAQSVVSTGSFQSRAEVVAAMSDPRYSNDPAFRNQVRAKMAGVNFF